MACACACACAPGPMVWDPGCAPSSAALLASSSSRRSSFYCEPEFLYRKNNTPAKKMTMKVVVARAAVREAADSTPAMVLDTTTGVWVTSTETPSKPSACMPVTMLAVVSASVMLADTASGSVEATSISTSSSNDDSETEAPVVPVSVAREELPAAVAVVTAVMSSSASSAVPASVSVKSAMIAPVVWRRWRLRRRRLVPVSSV
mmetsp:Transcript_23966/g.58734  ORF Transcript_23966/g.58734 Transcript_23966/m.58734 type:complete len:204 (-) Transcript_23966:2058-2669(-)